MLFSDFELRGCSLGGIETWVHIPQWSLAVDVGAGPLELVRCRHIALTHAHIDHAVGLPRILALKQLYGMEGPHVYVPAQIAEQVVAMLAAWDEVQRFESRYHLVPVVAGERYPLRRGLELMPFRTYHVVPSMGYALVETVHKLRPELHGRPGHELARLKDEGVAITDPQSRTRLAITGDTLVQVLDRSPELYRAEVLVLECTFLDSRKSYEHSRAGGHIHLDDLMARAEHFANRHLVLDHFSQIYRRPEIPQLLEPLAAAAAPQLHVFPTRPEGRAGDAGEDQQQVA